MKVLLSFFFLFFFSYLAITEAEPRTLSEEKAVALEINRPSSTPLVLFSSPGSTRPEDSIDKSFLAHQLLLHPTAGLTSTLLFPRNDGQEQLAKVRGLLVLDGKLLVVPFRYDERYHLHLATFPTPEKNLQYQIQTFLENGKTRVSQRFSANPQCAKVDMEKILQRATLFPQQASLIEHSYQLERDAEMTTFLLREIPLLIAESQ